MIKEETQSPQPRFSAQWCRVKISKFNRESNGRLRLNWQCNRLRLHFIFGQFNGLRLTITITPCLFNTVNNFRASISCSKILNDKKYFNTVKNFRSNLFFRAWASCSKILNDKKYTVNTVKIFRENSVFQGRCKLFKKAERWKNFQCSVFSVGYIHLGVVRVNWASLVCNLD